MAERRQIEVNKRAECHENGTGQTRIFQKQISARHQSLASTVLNGLRKTRDKAHNIDDCIILKVIQ
jgi:hypothetical protein